MIIVETSMSCVANIMVLRKHLFNIIFNKHNTSKRYLSKFDISNLKILQKNTIKNNAHIYLQILGSGATGAPKSLYVHTTNDKFLFNCGEGIRRIAAENNRELSKISGLFITSNNWQNISGIPELQERMNVGTKRTLKTYGPRGLESLMNTFSKLDKELNYTDLLDEEIVYELSLNILAVPIYSSKATKEKNRSTSTKDMKNKGKYVLAYICKPIPSKGYVTTEKLVSAGVPPGPLVHRLKDGLPVVLPNGKSVSPEDVSQKAFKGGNFIVVDIPKRSYLNSLITCSDFHPYQSNDKSLDQDLPTIIIHFSPPEVMEDSRYQEWARRFSPSVSHCIINERNSCLGLKDSLIMQMRLNQLLPVVFPKLYHSGIPFVSNRSENPNSEGYLNVCTLMDDYKFGGPTMQTNSLLKFLIRPTKEFDSSNCPVIYPNEAINACYKEESIVRAIEDMKRKFKSIEKRYPRKINGAYPSILFLGTGSACPSNIRNVSSILLNADCKTSVLLDCGEGTFNQLVRFMGKENAESTLMKLKLIFISHHHFDHHMGLVTILLQRQIAFKNAKKKLLPLRLLVTPRILSYLKDMHFNCIPILDNVTFISNANFVNRNMVTNWEYEDLCDSLRFREVSLTYVLHVNNSYGIAITHEDGWKIAYSGDTKPCKNLVKIGKNCDLLIHEASFEDGMEEEAEFKRHSTVSQAVQVGREMEAKFIILTHFSQRYFQVPLLGDEILHNVGIAYDNMMVTFDDFPYLPHLYPVLKEIFYDSVDKLKLRSYRKQNFK